ncbi:sulfate adenylyltransferase subunit CysN [Sphingomonas piscis]|uniref:sulfate adenylyltransferase subunit CysN n=1 Tax=Sphingomonas piscis TaxID=2714943 RepID=UPI001FEA8016|nr:sulfate adenylyltransferase subunit CysN [Sphingomonas piscis]
MATVLKAPSRADEARAELDAYLALNQKKSLLRFLTCGSVDDGKSTLIGRLLYDSKMLFEDQLASLEAESKKIGTTGGGLDFALLVDGLGAEREQGITIDVAYRFFATDKRKFIVADTPGHEQYTRNMVTGASTADLAVILIDATKGVITQTRRHSYLVNLLGIPRVVLAVNKMDLVGYDRATFERIERDYAEFARAIGITDVTAIPLSALAGDNVTSRSTQMDWYDGPSLLDHLEAVPTREQSASGPFALPVQWVNRPNRDFRGYTGTIAGGRIRPGDPVVVLPSGRRTEVQRIVTFEGYRDEAVRGQSITLTLADEVDCSRGNIIASPDAGFGIGNKLAATLVWMSDEPLADHRSYWLKLGTQTVSTSVSQIEAIVDVNTLVEEQGSRLELNSIARCKLHLDRNLVGAPYTDNSALGGFILIDKLTNATVAAGMIAEIGQSDPQDVHDPAQHIAWIQGVAAAEGAVALQQRLGALGRPVFVLGNEILDQGLTSDLADDPEHAAERVRRAREAALLLARAGVEVLVTIQASSEETVPGRVIDAAELIEESDGEWMI